MANNPDLKPLVPGGKLIDIHAHLWRGREDADAEGLVEEAERFGAEYVAVSHLWGRCPTPAQVREGNDIVSSWQKRSGGLLRGVTVLNPRHGQAAVDELRRCRAEHGFGMVKLWVACRCTDPCVRPVVEAAVELGLPVLQHAFWKAGGNSSQESYPEDVAELARQYPEARILMAHLAGDYIRGVWAVRDTPNVWSDISGTYCEAGMVETAVRELGAERVVFGTDNGIAFNLGKVQDAEIPDEAKARILCANAKDLLP